MSDPSLDELNASQDVVWDFELSARLASRLDAAAGTVEGMVAPRNSRKERYGQQFQGYYSELWAYNIETANRDASLLASRLRNVAQGVRDLAADAQAEQERINAAKKWRQQRDERSGWDLFWEGADFFKLFHGDAAPPRADPIPQLHKVFDAPALGKREEFGGTREGGVSSALPDDLRTFVRQERAAAGLIRDLPNTLSGLLTDFREKCQWGQLTCDGVLAGFRNYITSNENDCIRTDVIADNFEAAGGKGNISTLSNDAIAESLAAHGVSEKRPELEIPAVEAIGNPPTSGYSNDPVNTATGNFVENEEDLRFEGASALLGWARSYSSLNKKVGGHGLGWASFDGCDLRFTEDGATWTLVDGREVFFPRLGDGFGRAAHDNYWLAAGEHGFVVSNNGGAKWEHGTSGRLTSFTLGDGASIFFDHDPAGRLVRVRHSRGRQIDLEWADDRISAVQGDDGSRVEYRYIDGHLVEAEGPLGSRRYEWDEHGLIATVIDGDGVTLVHNTYDDEGRVVKQISPYGRATRFGYLPGRVTVVSDVDGSRSNSWLADSRGRVVGIIDSDGNRSSMAYDRWGNQVFSRDPEGQVTVREFDDHGRLVTELLPSGAMTRLEHDHLGRLTAIISLEDEVEVTRTSMAYDDGRQQPSVIVDGEGGRTQLHWDEGLLLDVVDPVGVRVDFEYDSRGDLVASVDADGNTTRLVRDASGRVIELVKPSGATTRYEYTAAGLLSARTDPDGAVWRYDYTTGGRLAGFINPLGERTALEYGSHGEPCAVIDPLGRRVEQEFDDLGNISRVRLPDGATWEFTHDAMSRLRHTVDPSGGVWQRHYDQFGRLNETRDPTGVRWFQHHNTALREITAGDDLASITVRKDRWGRQVSETLPDGSTTFTRYDRAGRVVELVDAVGARTSIERDLAGRVVQIRRPSGGTLRYDYDVCGRVAGVRNELGFRTELGYDVDSQLVRELWPTGEQGWSRHDKCGRVTARFSPGVGRFTWVYDKAGRITQTTDPFSGKRQFRYDAAGQLVAAVAGNGGVTRYVYDTDGRAVSITDPLGGVTERIFDPMDRCTSETNPLGHTAHAVYDPAGRLIRNIDADGRVVEISHDQAGLEASIQSDGRVFSRTTRDVAARQVTVVDHSDPQRPTTHTLSYDPRGLLLRHDRTTTGGVASIHWSYDADGRTTSITAPNGATTAYRRDVAGNIIAVTHPGIATAVLERDPMGRLIRASAGEASHEWTHHDGFITSHALSTPAHSTTSVMDYTPEGQLAAVTVGDATTRYSYDMAGQLTSAVSPTTTNAWTYDLAGRIVTETIDHETWHRVHNAAGELLQATNGTDTVTYTYDRSGRRTGEAHSDGSRRSFEWTALSRLSCITEHNDDRTRRTSTVVDALGHLCRINEQTLFIDDLSDRVLQTGDETFSHAGPLTATSTHGWLTPSWRPHRATSPTNPYQPPQRTSAGLVGIGPAGEIELAGLEWLGARVLDPASNSFLSPDPLDPVPATGWAANPYAYAGNNPTHLYDPTGLRPITTEELDAYRKANSPKWGTALTIVAGAALTIFGGPAGIAAAVAIGAGLGAGGNLIDQATSGYPIDWKQVSLSGALGGLGGGIGAAAGSLLGPLAGQAFSRLAGSPIGQRALQAGIGGATGGISGFFTGGLSAMAIGGNFWQGAWQGARAGATSGLAGGALPRTPAKASATPEAPTAPSTRFKDVDAEVRTTSTTARRDNDMRINPDPPLARGLERNISRSETQNRWKDERIEYLESIGAEEIRVNQHQINFSGNRVGVNLPDMQYNYNSKRYYEEVDRSTSPRGPGHAERILANDPDGIVYLWTVD